MKNGMKALTLSIVVLLLTSLTSGAADGLELAVIVNKENPIQNLSSEDLAKIFKQEKQYWDQGKKIYFLMQEAGSAEKEIVLRKIFKMDPEALKKFWLTLMFRGEITSFPKTLSSNAAVKRFVGKSPASIGYIDASDVDDSVKTLRVDGKRPGDPGYLLSDR
jgi:ABC-type phosphate transport system substrate-binding protein